MVGRILGVLYEELDEVLMSERSHCQDALVTSTEGFTHAQHCWEHFQDVKANIPTSSLCGNTPIWERYNIQENVLGNLHQNVFVNAKDKVSGSLSLPFWRKVINYH